MIKRSVTLEGGKVSGGRGLEIEGGKGRVTRKEFERLQEQVHDCTNFRLRCDTIDDSGGSTQRHDDEDKCAK